MLPLIPLSKTASRLAPLPVRLLTVGVGVVGLALSSTAHAATYNVGDQTGTNWYPSLGQALSALRSAGNDAAGDEIVIHSAEYQTTDDVPQDAGPCQNPALPAIPIDSTLTIRSTGGSAATEAIPPLGFYNADVTLEGLTILGGEGSNYFGEGTACQGPVVGDRGSLTMNDVVLDQGPWYSFGDGIDVNETELELTDVEIREMGAAYHGINADAAPYLGGSIANLTNVSITGAEGAYFFGYDQSSATNLTITGSLRTGLELSFGAWVITDSTFSGNANSAIYQWFGSLDIQGSTFTDNESFGDGAAIHGDENVIRVANSTFTGNFAERGGAIFWSPNDENEETLELYDVTFDDNNADWQGGTLFSYGRVHAERVTVQNGAALNAGGGFYLYEDTDIIDSTFDGLSAGDGGEGFYDGAGGAIFVNETWYDDQGLRLTDVTFNETYAQEGGAIYATRGTAVFGRRVTATETNAEFVGGFMAGGTTGMESDGPALLVRELYGVQAEFADLSITGASAVRGAAFDFGWGGDGSDIRIERGTFEDIHAVELLEAGTESGLGGIAFLDQETRFVLKDSEVVSSRAEGAAALIASGYPSGGEVRRLIGEPGLFCPSISDSNRVGNVVEIDGLVVGEASALFSPGGVYNYNDDVKYAGVDFGSTTADTTELSAEVGLITTFDVLRFEMSCSSFCAGDGAGWVAQHLDSRSLRFEDPARPEIVYSNNTFTENVVSQGVIQLDVCVADGFGIPQEFLTGQGNVFDSGDTGFQLPEMRGEAILKNNTFLNNAGTAFYGYPMDFNVHIDDNIFDGSEVGVELDGVWAAYGGHNLWANLDANTAEQADDLFPGPGAVLSAPSYASYTAETCDNDLWLADGSAGVDVGNPNSYDPWNDSAGDIGAFGGREACWPDVDEDGVIAPNDCNDDDPRTYPGAYDFPYDGIDQDCVDGDLCDVDEDGYDSTHPNCGGDDCDDALASVHPGAEETPYDGWDQDCDGHDMCDVDDDGVNAIGCEHGIDCNDDDASIYPGAVEIAGDLIDSDCDGELDPPVTGCVDEDEDLVCAEFDCDDTDPDIHPGAEEIPYDGIDQDCDGEDDCDVDRDGYIAANAECGGDDCNDEDPTVHPGAGEIPDDGIDQDCDNEDEVIWVQGGSDCNCSSAAANPGSIAWIGGLALIGLLRRRRE